MRVIWSDLAFGKDCSRNRINRIINRTIAVVQAGAWTREMAVEMGPEDGPDR